MLVLTLAIGCDKEEPSEPAGETVIDLSAPGPYRVGYREETFTWDPPLTDEPRNLQVAVWYPTTDTTGSPVTYQGLFPDEIPLGGAQPAFDPRKVLFFSHGHQAYGQASSFLMDHFASHGWWVIAPDHTGNTTFDSPDRTTEIYWERPLDILELLQVWDDVPVVLAGHSFGGYTAHAVGGARYDIDTIAPACFDGTDTSEFCSTMTEAQADLFRQGFETQSIAAILSMAPGDWRLFGDGLAEIDVPVMLMTGGLDPGQDGDAIWSDLDGPEDVHIHLPEGGHNTFTDFAGVLDGEGVIAPEEGFAIVRRYALAFAEAMVGDAPDAAEIVYGQAEPVPGVERSLR